MDTEIKSTLFRFVNLRAPELLSDVEKSPSFIIKPQAVNTVFETVATTIGSKREALQNVANTFETTSGNVLTVEGIKDLSIPMYDFSQWLSKNRHKAKDAEIKTKVTVLTNVSDLVLVKLWNNLIYQVVTQKDFYAKESLLQLLIANHVVEETTKGTYKERALAKVVLPKNLFVENTNTNTDTSAVARLSEAAAQPKEVLFSNFIFQSLENQALAKENIKVLSTLQEELALAEKAYQKEYQGAYESAYEEYQNSIEPILQNHAAEVEASKSKWCEIKDPNVVYDPKDPCQQLPVVPEPKLPKFEFAFRQEMDSKFLSEFLSPQSFEAYQNLLNSSTEEDDDDILQKIAVSRVNQKENTTFSETNNYINQLVDYNNNAYSQNTVIDGTTSIIIGGTTLVVPNITSPLQSFEYEVKTRRRSRFFSSHDRTLTIMVGLPDASWNITAIQYKLTRIDDTFVVKSSTAVLHKIGFDIFSNLSFGSISSLKELSITFQFANGKIATVLFPKFVSTTIYKGTIALPIDSEDSKDKETGDTGAGSTISPDQSFIPMGFGVKQIGVADYNKVEQTIQGYIEGEVAHIENIMAREFKEKSTRRLRRSEVTETTSSETERENLTDTSTVDRFEMQSEVAKVIASSKDFNAGANVRAHYGISDKNFIDIGANVNYATNNSKEESTRTAMTNAKEITERALDRIVSKVKEERIEKILEEFEENNTHGFDNRKGDQHVVGVYRWVDKVFKNQIVNYGKRLMFEFAIPEPARLHNLAMTTLVNENKAKKLSMPQDPRTATSNKLENYSQLDDAKLQYWSGVYNVEFTQMQKSEISIGKVFSFSEKYHSNGERMWNESELLDIPEGYYSVSAKVQPEVVRMSGVSWGTHMLITAGDKGKEIYGSNSIAFNGTSEINFNDLKPYTQKIPIGASIITAYLGTISFTINLRLTAEAENQWKKETFNAIIKAYEKALEAYNQALSIESANGVQILGTNPGFYREIENTILRKNCISYMISSNPDAKRTFGKDFYTINNNDTIPNFNNTTIKQTADLDNYSAFVKFIEQAFEWDIMSYYFYPFYWGNRNNWVKMYQYDQTHDHIFKAFMQSGMARVVVTVRPGFEEAVRYYMQTGQIWNGGEVPVIGDEFYLSIVEEMRKTVGEKVGEAWPTRVPTSMTILQADSIGLKVDRALPYNDDLSDFENEDEVPRSNAIKNNLGAQIGVANVIGTARLKGKIVGNNGINAKIVLRTIAGTTQDITYCADNGIWELKNLPEGKFELFLDANLDFPIDTYHVVEGAKQLVVELVNNETIEVNIVYEPM